jgi:hippurate hydrolase
MDALPVEERTGLPYASKVTAKNSAGVTVPVMHACGHDVHMSSLIGAADLLARSKARWRGTLVLIAQPDEEMGDGAGAMVRTGADARFEARLRRRVPRLGFLPAGKVGATPGFACTSVDSGTTVRGRGGHGSTPQYLDPRHRGARIVEALQTIVAREQDSIPPSSPWAVHGGTKHNIIPDDVKLQLTVRPTKEDTRRRILAAVAHREAEAAASGRRRSRRRRGRGSPARDLAIPR